jgi:hypothetical protein
LTELVWEQDTVQLHVFIADNLALFDYKTMEEVFQVLQQLKQLLSVSGQQVLYNLPKLEAEDDNSPIEEASIVEEDTSLYQVGMYVADSDANLTACNSNPRVMGLFPRKHCAELDSPSPLLSCCERDSRRRTG